ncbi:MAG: hypothetical protein CBB68_11470 [Rhodospirillaceae bacterium TMED8]|nr:hydrolase [Magnetovibrio sp.]OUT49616.1 MAG: hypothetical protein CBB68_11470 [Rhodospirillaceae bacterium TMED8]|tara:strand:+ start:6095 stop:7933 length:1839 start_codon:yes stop_codon:yes gene_type:complete
MVSYPSSNGWFVSPSEYLKQRHKVFKTEQITSQYVSVRDGTKLAVDVHLPRPAEEDSVFPTIVVLTPYYRRFALSDDHRSDIDAAPTIAFYRDIFLPRGYALVAVDIRGSGASFGCRDGFRSPVERLDHYDVVEWVNQQPWCSGRIGATGISYPGAASDFLASMNHSAVKAVAPLFAVWDTWGNHLYPGGILLTCVTKNYGTLAESLDQNKRELIPSYAYFKDNDLNGPAPVDSDPSGEMLQKALYEHKANFDMQDFAQQLRFRDDGLSDNPEYTGASISPYHYANRDADASTPYFTVSGWMDGGGYSTGTIQRYLWLRNPESCLVLGPWDHGARAHVSPWRPNLDNQQLILGAAILRFFDKHLLGINNAIDKEKSVHYYTMGAEEWRSSDHWPPDSDELCLYMSENRSLAHNPSTLTTGVDTYKIDYACGTGHHTRYDRLYLENVETYYDDWDGRNELMLNYTSTPLVEQTEVTGHPSVEIHFSASERDCCFFVYISDITPEGTAIYVTEGVFRAIHRASGQQPSNIPATGPVHSFNRKDAKLIKPDKPTFVAFELFPTSYVFKKDHRIQLSIAGADSDHFTKIPDGRPPELKVFRTVKRRSRILLPIPQL